MKKKKIVLWPIIFQCFSKLKIFSARRTNSWSPEDESDVDYLLTWFVSFQSFGIHAWLDFKITTRRRLHGLHGTIFALIQAINIQRLCFPWQKQCSLIVDILHSLRLIQSTLQITFLFALFCRKQSLESVPWNNLLLKLKYQKKLLLKDNFKKSTVFKNEKIFLLISAIFKTWIRRVRTRIRRMRRTWRTQGIWRIRRTRRILRIRRIQRIRKIFKRFLSFIYSPTKGFTSSSKLSSELYLAEGWTTNK